MNIYSQAIEILKGINDKTATALLFEIAKNNPGALVAASRRLFGETDPVIKRIQELASSGKNKIDCIKEYRALTKSSLQEALHFVENLVPGFRR